MEQHSVILSEVSLAEVYRVHERIPEFTIHFPYSLDTFLERTKDKEMLALVASVQGQAAGYMVGYDRDGDGSFYCWMTGVDPEYRRKGILQSMMTHMEDWSKAHGYHTLRIKTRNHRREMLSFLVKNDFLFIAIEPQADVTDNRILLEKKLDFV